MKLISATLIIALGSLWCETAISQDAEDNIDATYAVDFPGGTLVDYIDLIRETVPRFNHEGKREPANIFIADSARELRVPPVQVTTNMDGALGILEVLSNEYQNVLVGPDPSGNITVISVDGRMPVTVEVINGKQLLKAMDKESLLSAIQIGLQMLGDDEGIELKLHEETGLLFVKGVQEKTELVKQVIDELYKANPVHLLGRSRGGQPAGSRYGGGRGLGPESGGGGAVGIGGPDDGGGPGRGSGRGGSRSDGGGRGGPPPGRGTGGGSGK